MAINRMEEPGVEMGKRARLSIWEKCVVIIMMILPGA